MKNILLIRFSSLGDIVLQTSVMELLEFLYPDKHRIVFLTSKEFAPIFQDDPRVSEVMTLDRKKGLKELFRLRKVIKEKDSEQKIDLIIDLHKNTRSTILRWFLFSIPSLVINKHSLARKLFVLVKNKRIKKYIETYFLPIKPQVYRQLEDWKESFDVKDNWVSYFNFLKNKKRSTLTFMSSSRKLPADLVKNSYIALAPVASFESKRWPIAYYKKLLQLCLDDPNFDSYSFVVVGGPSDDYVEEMRINHSRVTLLQGKTNLAQSIDVMGNCLFAVGNDSGMNHIAEAFQKPVVTIFGSTHPIFGFSSHHPLSKNIQKDVSCRPCSTTGDLKCFRDQMYCLNQTMPEEVKNAMVEVLKGLNC